MAFSATFEYKLVDRYTQKIKTMQRATTKLRGNMKLLGTATTKLGTRLGKASSKLANLRTGFAAMMAGRGIKATVEESYNFERALNKVNAVTGATTVRMAEMRKEARRLGITTKFSSVQAAEGMAVLGQKGFDTAKILKTLPSIILMATAGDIELAEASQMVTGALYSFELQAGSAAHIADVYALTAAKTAANMSDLNAAMINAAPLAHAAGVSFEEVAALVGIMSNKNIMGSKSGTLLMNAFRNIVKPTREAIGVLKKFGFKKEQWTDDTGKIVDFIRVLELFQETGIGIAEIFKIFQVRGAKGTAALMGQTDAIRALIKKYEEQTGAAAKMADVMMWGVVRPAVEARSAWEGMKEAIGKSIEPITIHVFGLVKRFSQFVAIHPGVAKFIGTFLLVAAAVLSVVTVVGVLMASLAGVAMLSGSVMTAIAGMSFALIGGLGLVVAMLTLVIARWDDFKWGIQLVGEGFVTIAGKIGKAIFNIKDNIVQGILWPFQQALELFTKLKDFVGFGDTKHELSSSATRPDQLGTSNKVTVENIIRGSIDINDHTGGRVTTGGGGGIMPLNVVSQDGYAGEGAYQ